MDSYIYVVWDESKACYPDNKPNNFWLELPSTLILQGEWCIALMDVKIKTQTKNSIFLLSNVYAKKAMSKEINTQCYGDQTKRQAIL